MWLWSSNQAFGHLGCPSLIVLFFLREDKMRKKLFLALIALTACCGYGCAEDDGSATCTEGQRRCYGEHSQVCKDGAYTTEKCTMGCDAVSGKCNTSPVTPKICDDGKFQCADGKLEKCVSNAWVKQEECPADRCDATVGKCNPAADKVCDEGKFQCADGKLNKCVSNAWVKQEECPADRCDATAGKCNTENQPADKCTNGKFKCENDKLYKCENESWNAGTDCPAATHICNAEATDEAGACVVKSTEPADKCMNGKFKCENDKLYKCENEAWNTGTDCPTATHTCNAEATDEASACVEKSTEPAEKCTNGKFKCENDKLYKCENEAWNTGKDCPAATHTCNAEAENEEMACVEKSTEPPAEKCTNGKFKCENDKLYKCENESWDAGTACPAAKCNAETGVCNEEQPPADKCETGKFKCENDKLFKCENESWDAGTACPAAKCNAETGVCNEEQPQLEKCTATSTKKCEATCNTDKKGGYYWGGQSIVKLTCSNKQGKCYTSQDKAFVGCGSEVPYCEADSKKTCQKKCLDDGSKGYYWGNNKINEYVCVNNDCMISSKNRVACVSDEPADTKAACSGDGKVSCENSNMMVKYCDAKTNTYWTKRCAQCTVNEKATAYYCDGKIPCKNGGKTQCVNSCDSKDARKYYVWNNNKVEEKSCGVRQVCKDIEGGTQCVKK